MCSLTLKKLVVFKELEKELISVVIAVKMQVRVPPGAALGPCGCACCGGTREGPPLCRPPPPSPLLGEGRACADLCCGPKTCSLLLSPSPEPYPRPNALCSQALVPSVPRASEAPLLPLSKRRVLRGRDPSPQCPLRPAALEEGSC